MLSEAEKGTLAGSQRLACLVCGHEDIYLADHLLEIHNLTEEEYCKKYPFAKTTIPELLSLMEERSKGVRREAVTSFEGLTVQIPHLDLTLDVNHDVPEAVCLKQPSHFRLPQAGALGQDVEHFLMSWVMGRSIWVHGLPGCGKDALVHWLSWVTRRPTLLKSFRPQADLESWFYTQGLNGQGSYYAEGAVLQALRDGYRTPTGRVVPYMLLFTDIDRADRNQAEILRMILDTTQKRVEGPMGEIYPVYPGTQIILTSNTIGSGDARGRCTSANVIDASLIDRAERVFEFNDMSWEDEEIICKNKWPKLAHKFPEFLPQIGNATEAARAAVRRREVAAEFSHRALEKWLGHAEDILHIKGEKANANGDLLRSALRAYLSSLPDEDTRARMESILDAHLLKGAVNDGGVNPSKKKLREGF